MARSDHEQWVEVFPANCDAFLVFVALEQQWEFPGAMGGRLTVALTEVEAAMRLLRIKDRVDCYRRVRVLIAAATPILRLKIDEARSRG